MPFYHEKWFWLIVVPMLLGTLAACTGNVVLLPWLFGFAGVMAFGLLFGHGT